MFWASCLLCASLECTSEETEDIVAEVDWTEEAEPLEDIDDDIETVEVVSEGEVGTFVETWEEPSLARKTLLEQMLVVTLSWICHCQE